MPKKVLIERFHTYDYARHFLSACTRILGLETMPNGIEFEGRYAQVGTFPIGIDPTQFTEMIREPKVVDRVRALKERFKGCKVSRAGFDGERLGLIWWGGSVMRNLGLTEGA
jgi:trehalose-6-phosphate synthase